MSDGVKPEDYRKLLTEIIQKQIIILGPEISLLKAKNVDPTNYINLASNLYRGAEKGQAQAGGSGMVGGC